MFTHFAVETVRDFVHFMLPVRKSTKRLRADDTHLDAAQTYLLRTIEHGGGRASSKAYQVGRGWMPPYRETTGYIIPTLLDLSERFDRPDLAVTAEGMGDWLAEIQEPGGGFVERELEQGVTPIVFNTGQILHGFNALILRRGQKQLVENARRAGDFLVASADAEGSFSRNAHFDIAHTYNVRSAWALMTLGGLLEEKKYEATALANADWTLAQQCDNGFFLNNIFQPGRNANTHGIAYVLRGLLEIYFLSKREAYLAGVRRTADRLVSLYGARRRLVAEFGDSWEPLSSHVCLTGCAQLAIVFFKLYGIDSDKRYLNAALNLLDDVAATQNLSSPGKPHYGAIKGSFPIYGRYAPQQYPNWATKFFIDALLAKQGALNGSSNSPSIQLSAG